MSRKNKVPLAVIVGANITAKRKLLGMTQGFFAEKIGIGPDSLSRIESGITAPKFQTLEKMAHALDCSVAELFLHNQETFIDFNKNFNDPDVAMSEIIIMAEKIIKIAKTKSDISH